jgi:hypothetical protein
MLLLLFGVLGFLFHDVFLPGHTLFSNDGPLGALMCASRKMPEAFRGVWQDLNTLGFREGGAQCSMTYGLWWLVGPLGYSKLYAPLALLFLGMSAWCFFRSLNLAPVACVLAGLAASLNSGFFSAGCWGVAAHPLTIGLSFLALAALVDTPLATPEPSARSAFRRWARVALAGLAVGMGVVEGADIGAIFSVFVALFVVFQSFIAEGPRAKNLTMGLVRTGLVAAFAGFLAIQTISVLVATQIQGVAGTQQDTKTKEERWDFATQWSLPKREGLALIVPGLFGYRMDTPQDMSMFGDFFQGGAYWGAAGRDLSWYRFFANGEQGPPPVGPLRFTGGGNYPGILVSVVAVWAALQAFRKKDSAFSSTNARWVKFWTIVAIVGLLLAFGRFAPFYRIVYALPYFSTIRNPAKFIHVFNWAWVIVFAYGLHALWCRYVEGIKETLPAALSSSDGAKGKPKSPLLPEPPLQTRRGKSPVRSVGSGRGNEIGAAAWSFKGWWQQVVGFDRRWVLGSLAAFACSVLAWLVYASSRDGFEKYLQQVGFDAGMAKAIAGFSLGQVFWFLLFFAVALGLVTLVLSGAFAGLRAKWAGLVLGLFLVVDLGRANLPYIVAWDYEQKYASNPIIDKLRENPYEHRVAVLPRYFSDPNFLQAFRLPKEWAELEQYFGQVYGIEWAQHHFLYYNVQSLDLIQLPRFPEDLMAFENALQPRSMADLARLVVRRWELTNTRYLLGAAPFLDLLNQGFDPVRQRFRIVERFQIVPKPGIVHPTKLPELTAVPATNGNFALFEFTGALPRAKLYSNWQMAIDDKAALSQLSTNALSAADADALKQGGTNDFLTLRKLASPEFDPQKTVLLAEPLPRPAPTGTNETPGKVEFASYAPKNIVFKTEAAAPAVLLLNDRYDPNWKVTVDAKPEKLLRCNYLMRGVYLPAGSHRVEFAFQQPMQMFYVSLIAVCTGLLLCGLLVVVKDRPPSEPGKARTVREENAEERTANLRG